MSNLYGHARRSGPIRTKMTRPQMMRIASRIGKVAFPRTGVDIFAKLAPYHAFKGWTPNLLPMTKGPQPFIPLDMAKSQRSQIRPDSGIAAPAQTRGLAAQTTPQPATPFKYVSNFRDEWIDDRQWGAGNTLPELVGSGMLTQQQLQATSINNILSMFEFQGGSEQERLEMGYLLQRFALEGYVRGVDVLAQLRANNAKEKLVIKIGTVQEMTFGTNPDGTPMVGAGLSWPEGSAHPLEVWFLTGFWQGCSDAAKLAVFSHEFGHQLVGWADSDYYYGIKGEFDKDPTTVKTFFGHLFAEGPLGSHKDFNYLEPADKGVPTTIPGGFPQIGGSDVGAPDMPTNFNNNIYNITPPQVAPPPMPSMAMPGRAGQASSPEDMDKTPVAGMLPQMNELYSFQAGLSDIMRRNSKTLTGLAGAVTGIQVPEQETKLA